MDHAVYVLDGLGRESRRRGYRDTTGPISGHRLTRSVNRDAFDLFGQLIRGEITPGLPPGFPVFVHADVVIGLAPAVGEQVPVKGVERRNVDLLQRLRPYRRLQVRVLVVGVV